MKKSLATASSVADQINRKGDWGFSPTSRVLVTKGIACLDIYKYL